MFQSSGFQISGFQGILAHTINANTLETTITRGGGSYSSIVNVPLRGFEEFNIVNKHTDDIEMQNLAILGLVNIMISSNILI